MNLWDLYRLAGRPTLKRIVAQVSASDRDGTASQETVRKVLQGATVPRWLTFEAFLEALCELAKVDLTAEAGSVADSWTVDGSDQWYPERDTGTVSQRFQRLWNEAFDEAPPAPVGPSPRYGYDEEPPF